MEFEWDNRKAAANLKKHKVDFNDAVQIFRGFTVEDLDTSIDHDEERVRAVGEHRGALYIVIYVDRENIRRIISARKADKSDREEYYKNFSG